MNAEPFHLLSYLRWVVFESYKGRIGRMDFFLRYIALTLASFVLAGLVALAISVESVLLPVLTLAIGAPLWLLVYYRSITLDIQRLHDHNLSGWWVLVIVFGSLVPLVNIVVALAVLVGLFFLRGTVGGNGYGPDPLEQPAAAASEPAVVKDVTPPPPVWEDTPSQPPTPKAKPVAKQAPTGVQAAKGKTKTMPKAVPKKAKPKASPAKTAKNKRSRK